MLVIVHMWRHAGGAGAAFGAQYLPKDMLMGNRERNRNLLQVIQSKWGRSQETEEHAEEQ